MARDMPVPNLLCSTPASSHEQPHDSIHHEMNRNYTRTSELLESDQRYSHGPLAPPSFIERGRSTAFACSSECSTDLRNMRCPRFSHHRPWHRPSPRATSSTSSVHGVAMIKLDLGHFWIPAIDGRCWDALGVCDEIPRRVVLYGAWI